MTAFAKLLEIRADGKIIPEGMPLEDVWRLSEKPEKVIAVQWEHKDQVIALREERGLLFRLVKSRRYAVIKPLTSSTGQSYGMKIVDQSGHLVHTLEPIVRWQGEAKAGVFCWFESHPDVGPDEFDVIFEPSSGPAMVRVRYEASSGEVKAVAGYR